MLQEFSITSLDRPRKESLIVDSHSRIPNQAKRNIVDDDLPQKHSLFFYNKYHWYENVANYFV